LARKTGELRGKKVTETYTSEAFRLVAGGRSAASNGLENR